MRLRLGCSSGGVRYLGIYPLLAFQAPTGLLLVSETLFFSFKEEEGDYVRTIRS